MNEEKLPKLLHALALPASAEPLLREALTHRTYAVEHHLSYDNQRMEFLGDAVLEILLTDELFRRCPELSEGDLTKIRSALSCEDMLARLARKLHFGDYLLIGNGEKETGGNERNSTLADLFEAVLGAIYLSAGMERIRTFALELFQQECPDPRCQLLRLNPKGRLQELSQHRWGCTPEYHLFRSGGPQHLPFYEVEVRVAGYTAFGRGTSRKHAEIAAASLLCDYLSRQEESDHAQSSHRSA